MKPLSIPCFFYPTTAVLVDDDSFFVQSMAVSLRHHCECKVFSQPFAALEFLEAYQPRDPMTAFVSKAKFGRNMQVDLHQIRQLLADKQRHEQITVLVLDYQMPGLNGLEFAKQVNVPHLKKILLTGEADATVAVQAFNDKLINQFIHKGDDRFPHVVWQTIHALQWQYFNELSEPVIGSIQPNQPAARYLASAQLAELFFRFVVENDIREFYLLDDEANFLLVDKAGEQSQLILHDEQSLDALKVEAEHKYQEEPDEMYDGLLAAIRNKEQVPVFSTDVLETPIEEWAEVMAPLTRWQGDDHTYFAAVRKL